MERPVYNESITLQNDVYAMDVMELFRERPRTADQVLEAVFQAFILGAGGYEGSFDAALMLEDGGMAVLLENLGLGSIDTAPTTELEIDRFEDVIRAAVDYGAAYEELEKEIPETALGDGDILPTPFGAYTDRMNMLQEDGTVAPPDWRNK